MKFYKEPKRLGSERESGRNDSGKWAKRPGGERESGRNDSGQMGKWAKRPGFVEENPCRFGPGSFWSGRFGLGRFGQCLGWVVSALVGESFRPWVVFGPESFRPNFNRDKDRGSIG